MHDKILSIFVHTVMILNTLFPFGCSFVPASSEVNYNDVPVSEVNDNINNMNLIWIPVLKRCARRALVIITPISIIFRRFHIARFNL